MNLNERRGKPSENKQIFLKSLVFTLSFYILSGGIFLAGGMELVSLALSFFSLLLVFLVAAPTYFFLKSNIKNSWRYLANMAIVHGGLLLAELVSIYVLDSMNFFKGFDVFVAVSVLVVHLAGLGIILLLDLLHNAYLSVKR